MIAYNVDWKEDCIVDVGGGPQLPVAEKLQADLKVAVQAS